MRTKLVNSAILLLIGTAIYLAIILHPVVKQNLENGYFDFIGEYTGGRLVSQGESSRLYDYSTQQDLQRQLTGRPTPLPFNHPPFEALILAPFALLPYLWAYRAWTLLNFALVGLTAWLLRDRLANIRSLLLRAALLLAFFIPLFVALVQGQDTILILVLYALAFVSLKRGGEFRAGCFLGLGLLKFQLVLAFLPVFLVKRRWKVVAAFVSVSILLGLASLWMVGFAGLADWVRIVRGQSSTTTTVAGVEQPSIAPAAMMNLCGLFYGALSTWMSPRGLDLLVAIASIALVVWGVTQWSDAYQPETDRFDLLFALNLVVTLLASYHSYIHDLALLAIPLLLVFNHFETHKARQSFNRTLLTGVALALFAVTIFLFNVGSRWFWVLAVLMLILAFSISRQIGSSRGDA